jgi:hypothetical protein
VIQGVIRLVCVRCGFAGHRAYSAGDCSCADLTPTAHAPHGLPPLPPGEGSVGEEAESHTRTRILVARSDTYG